MVAPRLVNSLKYSGLWGNQMKKHGLGSPHYRITTLTFPSGFLRTWWNLFLILNRLELIFFLKCSAWIQLEEFQPMMHLSMHTSMMIMMMFIDSMSFTFPSQTINF